jgi:tryptophan synthase beta chain
MVREFHRVIGDEAREQCRHLTGADPDVVVACRRWGRTRSASSPGSSTSRHVSSESSQPAVRPSVAASLASSIGCGAYLMQDEYGQVEEAQSISAGLDYPGVGPEHAYLARSGAPNTRT